MWYRGQDFTCARCLRSHNFCPGKAVASECQKLDKENKLIVYDFDAWWEEVKIRAPLREMMGDEDRFDTEMLKLFSLPAGIEKEEVYDWILRNDVMIHEDQLCQAENPQMWYIIHVGMRNMKTIIKKLNKSIFGHPPNIKYINCAPVTLNTPQKAAYGIREPQDRPGN